MEPSATLPEPSSPPEAVPRLRGKQDPLNPEPLRIVIVDDEEIIVQLCPHLAHEPFRITSPPFTSPVNRTISTDPRPFP